MSCSLIVDVESPGVNLALGVLVIGIVATSVVSLVVSAFSSFILHKRTTLSVSHFMNTLSHNHTFLYRSEVAKKT